MVSKTLHFAKFGIIFVSIKHKTMKIRRREILDDFATKHADVRGALQHWVDIVEEAEWAFTQILSRVFLRRITLVMVDMCLILRETDTG